MCTMCSKTMRSRRNPIFCIIPPNMLRHIIEAGDEHARAAAVRTLSVDMTFRMERAAAPLLKRRRRRGKSPSITVRDAAHTSTAPGPTIRRTTGQPPTGDAAVDEAYDGLIATYDLYKTEFNRNSIDDKGLPLDATVHFGTQYDNAFWDGVQMVFGDGDGKYFNRFTIAIDVIGHELTHGVTQIDSGLVYSNQSGALNESLSDVFGSLLKQRALGQDAAHADWLIGAGLFTPKVKGKALRSMRDPGTAYDDPILGKDAQPNHMSRYVVTAADNGGVHINSGIPNRAFYLAASAIGGEAWKKPGQIWYHALHSGSTKQTTDFAGFKDVTIAAAETLHGKGSAEAKAVKAAWTTVGV